MTSAISSSLLNSGSDVLMLSVASLTGMTGVSSSDEHHKFFILNAIDKLRERKARPDVDRITALVYRQHKLQRAATAMILEKLVDHGVVVRVEYKGSVSYRNAAKWKRSSLSGSVLNSSVTSKRLADAVRSLASDREPEMQEIGFTFEEIEEALIRHPAPIPIERQRSQNTAEEGDSDSSGSGGSHEDELRGDTLRRALERESTAGGFVRLPGDRFALDEDGSRRQSMAEHMAKRAVKPLSSGKKDHNVVVSCMAQKDSLSANANLVQGGLKLIAPAPPMLSASTCAVSTKTPPSNTISAAALGFAHQTNSQLTPQLSVSLASLPAPLPPPPPHLPRSSQVPVASTLLPLSLPLVSSYCTELMMQSHSVSLMHSAPVKPIAPIARYAVSSPHNLQRLPLPPPIVPTVATPLLYSGQSHPLSSMIEHSRPTTPLSVITTVPSFTAVSLSSNTACIFTNSDNNNMLPKRGRPPGSKKKSNSRLETDTSGVKRQRLISESSSVCVDTCSSSGVITSTCNGQDTTNLSAFLPASLVTSASCASAPALPMINSSPIDAVVAAYRCDFCLSCTAPLLCCRDCSAKAHPACMNYTAELASRAQMSPWQCSECKTCCICEDSGDPELMLICDSCDKGYHTNCHTPSIPSKPHAEVKWICSRCRNSSNNIESKSHNLDSNLTDHDSQFLNVSSTTPPIDDSESEASSWGIEETALWLERQGFFGAAKAFREQEVDGTSLLLMKRMDVLTGLGLKLGPAVKVYDRIRRLQARGRILLTCD